VFASLANYSHQQHSSVTDTPPRSGCADEASVPRENAVAACNDSATVNSAAVLPALLSPSASQKQSLSLSLFINRGLVHEYFFTNILFVANF